MATELKPVNDTQQALSVKSVDSMWTPEDRKLIHETVAKGTSTSEFKLFLYTAAKYQLDPLVKQVWCVKYGNDPAQIFTGRDGFLSIAHRSGQFDGMESGVRAEQVPIEVKYYDKRSRKWVVGVKREFQYVGWCKVYRKDMGHPFCVEVWEEEYSTGRNLWKDKPRTMIQKVAESQCLRRAFDISGLYAPEEIDTDQEHEPVNVTPRGERPEARSDLNSAETNEAKYESRDEEKTQQSATDEDKEKVLEALNKLAATIREIGVNPKDAPSVKKLLESVGCPADSPMELPLRDVYILDKALRERYLADDDDAYDEVPGFEGEQERLAV